MSASEGVLLAIVVVVVAAAIVLFHPFRRSGTQMGAGARQSPSAAIYRDDDRYWWAGVFYVNSDDPEVMVPKRYGLGWTINFGHPMGMVIAVVMIAMILLPIALALFTPGLLGSGCHPSNCHLAP